MIDQPQSTGLQILGSSVVPLYVERKMKVFAITESEFASVATLNAQTTMFCSIGFAILSAAVSIWINGMFYTEVPPTALIAQRFIAPFGARLAAAFFWLAWRASKTRETTWTRIKEESALLAKQESVLPSV